MSIHDYILCKLSSVRNLRLEQCLYFPEACGAGFITFAVYSILSVLVNVIFWLGLIVYVVI